jgi:hypothetical protein
MPRPPYKGIKVSLFNTEYYIHTINLTSLHLTQHIIYHLADNIRLYPIFQRFHQNRYIFYN